MKRLLLASALAGLILVAGAVAVGILAWALAGLGAAGLVTPVLVLGLSAAVPLSIVAAGRLVPGRPGPVPVAASCPRCGCPIGGLAKPDPHWDT